MKSFFPLFQDNVCLLLSLCNHTHVVHIHEIRLSTHVSTQDDWKRQLRYTEGGQCGRSPHHYHWRRDPVKPWTRPLQKLAHRRWMFSPASHKLGCPPAPHKHPASDCVQKRAALVFQRANSRQTTHRPPGGVVVFPHVESIPVAARYVEDLVPVGRDHANRN